MPATGHENSAYEDQLLSNTRRLVNDSMRSGEGYFSADGTRFIYQSEAPDSDNPFYQIYVMDLASGESHRVSPGIGLTTCSWIHPTLARVMFAFSRRAAAVWSAAALAALADDHPAWGFVDEVWSDAPAATTRPRPVDILSADLPLQAQLAELMAS